MGGRPGASSVLRAFQELGPCLVNEYGNGTYHNPYGWSTNSSSYVDEVEDLPYDSHEAAVDTHRFLQLFISEVFPCHRFSALLIAESYAVEYSPIRGERGYTALTKYLTQGKYIPALGANIIQQNKLYPEKPQIHLQSCLVGNGFMSRHDTTFGYWETLCTTKPRRCSPDLHPDALRHHGRLHAAMHECHRNVPAEPRPRMTSAPLASWAGTWMRRTRAAATGSISPRPARSRKCATCKPSEVRSFQMESEAMDESFSRTADQMVSSSPSPLVAFLLENEVHYLAYQGNLDLTCNTAGNLRWAHFSGLEGTGRVYTTGAAIVDNGARTSGWE